jgi:hypothetical protein
VGASQDEISGHGPLLGLQDLLCLASWVSGRNEREALSVRTLASLELAGVSFVRRVVR